MDDPKLKTLIPDIYSMLSEPGNAPGLTVPQLATFGSNVAKHLASDIGQKEERKRASERNIYASELGSACPKQVAFKILNWPVTEAMPGYARIKFLIGDVLEEVVLSLAEAAGHKVEERQYRMEYKFYQTDWTVSGRIDAVVDGNLIDVKTCSEYAFKQYANDGITGENDKFGYHHQLQAYIYGDHDLENKPLSNLLVGEPYDKYHAGWILVNKSTGAIAYTEWKGEDAGHLVGYDWVEDRVRFLTKVELEIDETKRGHHYPPIPTKPEGKSGNMKLDTICSYCAFKKHCYPHVRKFIYASGPVYLTVVKKTPDVPEESLNYAKEFASLQV